MPRLAVSIVLAAPLTLLAAAGWRAEAQPIPPPTAEEVHRALIEGLSASGQATPESRTQNLGMSKQTYQAWVLDLELDNASPHEVVFGEDLLLVEADASGGSYEGVRLTLDPGPERSDLAGILTASEPGRHTYYSLGNSELRQAGGGEIVRRGRMFSFTVGSDREGGRPPTFGSLVAGDSRRLVDELEQGVWMREEHRASLRVVLPELRVDHGGEGPARFRWILYFEAPAAPASGWRVNRQDVIRLDPEGLETLLKVPETNLVTRVLAANWLAGLDFERARPALADVARGLPDGDLLAACLSLLEHGKGAGVEEHAMRLLSNDQGATGIRRLAAGYLGALAHGPAKELLITAASDSDEHVAEAAIKALGGYPGAEVGAALLEMAKEKISGRRSRAVFRTLASARQPEGLAYLADRARKSDEALSALIEEGAAESFDVLVKLGNAKGRQKDRRQLAQGVARAGGERAAEPLYAWVREETLRSEERPLSTSAVVDELVALDAPELLPQLVEAAREGHLPSLQVLAGSRHEAAREPLASLAREGSGAARTISLDGLSRNWPQGQEDLFRAALASPSTEMIEIGARGLLATAPAELPELLLPLLSSGDRDLRREAAGALAQCEPGSHAGALLGAALATDDEKVAAPLVTGLLDHGWSDRGSLAPLLEGLAREDSDLQYQIVRLLRRLSGGAMGPASYGEFDRDPEIWVGRWREWGEAQLAAGSAGVGGT